MLERLRRVHRTDLRRATDRIAVRTEDRAPVLLHELAGQGARRLRRIDAAGVGGEHVGVGLLTPLGSIDGASGDGHALLLWDLGTDEEQRALRHDAERAL